MLEQKKFEYKSGISFSKETIEGNLVKIVIYDQGIPVGESVLQLFTDDNIYYICSFNIIPDEQGKKNGSNLIEGINGFIRSKKARGLLENTIEDKDQLRDIYINHGWAPQLNSQGGEIKDFFVFEPVY